MSIDPKRFPHAFSPTTLAVLLGAAVTASAAPPSPDFNNDGFDDLVVGVPGDRDFGRSGNLAFEEGAVNIIRGSNNGLFTTGNQVWGQDSPNILGTGELNNQFGAAAAAGDFNGDGRSDLAAGSPGDSNADAGALRAGAVNILYGSGTALGSGNNQLFNQTTAGILRPGISQTDEHFGAALAGGDFNRDGFDDLAIGVPNEDLSSTATNLHGLVYVVYGSLTGLRTTTSQIWTQDSPGIADDAAIESQDRFGSALAAGDFDNDGFDDLAIGVPTEDLTNNGPPVGAVHVLYGSSNRLSSNRSQFWTQNSVNVLDASEPNDQFGAALAVGDFNRDGRDDLAIGVPGENPTTVNTVSNAGAVNVLYGATGGLSATGNQFWSQNTAGVADQAERNDAFGAALVAGDFNNDGVDDLAIGARNEDFGVVSSVSIKKGAVHVLFGSPSRLTANGNQFWTQDSPGIVDTAEDGDSFGRALGKGDYDGDGFDDLVIGVPFEDRPFCGSVQNADVGMVHVLYGSASGPTAAGSQIWCQNSPNILSDGLAGEDFGAALTP